MTTTQTSRKAADTIASIARPRAAVVGRKVAVDEAANEFIRSGSDVAAFVRNCDDDAFDSICRAAEKRI